MDPPTPSSASSLDPETVLFEAKRLHFRRNFEDAVKVYDELLAALEADLKSGSANSGSSSGAHTASSSSISRMRWRTEALRGKADSQKSAGRTADAADTLALALQHEPGSVGAFAELVQALRELERYPAAAALCEAAASRGALPAGDVRQQQAITLTDWGTAIKRAGASPTADASAAATAADDKYRAALALAPGYAPAHYNRGVLLSERGALDEARQAYERALAADPGQADAWLNLGVVHKCRGRLPDAIAAYQRALQLQPHHALAQANLAVALTDYGTALKHAGRAREARHAYHAALRHAPQYAEAWYNLGVAYGEAGVRKRAKAFAAYQLAIHFNPRWAEAHNNLGVLYKEEDELGKALECYQQAVLIRADYAQALNNLAVIHTLQGRLDDARVALERALSVQADYAEAWNNLGVLQRDEGDMPAALASYRRATSLAPSLANAQHNLLLALNYVADVPLAELWSAHAQWAAALAPVPAPAAHVPQPREARSPPVLRVGLLSPDLFTHSVSYFVEALLAHHGAHTHVTCYSCVAKEDGKSAHLRELASAWRRVAGLSADELAAQIRADHIDVLVELAGHTAGNRLDVLRRQPAPLQLTYLGYPNTTGLPPPVVAYRITDALADPRDTAQRFSEQLLRVPHFLCYSPHPQPPPAVSPLPALAAGHVTFGSFNNLAKVTPAVLATWAALLHAAPTARLLLKAKGFGNARLREHYLRAFEAHGVSRARVELLPLLASTAAHLATYARVDVALDTWPYCGTTTTFEALLMGVPVVSLTGTSHVHNVGRSILSPLGLQAQLLADTPAAYVRLAAALAADLPALSALRASLRQRLEASPLCNGREAAATFDRLYHSLYDTWVRLGGSRLPTPEEVGFA